jgi:hypothetical protein
VTAPASNFALFNHESLSPDLSLYFITAAPSAFCTLGYEIDVASLPPSLMNYVSIPTETIPTMDVSPTINVDETFGTFTFNVKAFYGGGTTPLPSSIVSASFTIELNNICLTEALLWDPLFETSYTIPVGQELTVPYTQTFNGQHLVQPDYCKLDFTSSGTALAPTAVVTSVSLNTGGTNYEFLIWPI